MERIVIEGTVDEIWRGKNSNQRYVDVRTEDDAWISLPTNKFEKGQRVQIEVKEVA